MDKSTKVSKSIGKSDDQPTTQRPNTPDSRYFALSGRLSGLKVNVVTRPYKAVITLKDGTKREIAFPAESESAARLSAERICGKLKLDVENLKIETVNYP